MKVPKKKRRLRVAVTGTLASGKTVFLTSLIWHLRNHSHEHFRLGEGVSITGFRELPEIPKPFGPFPWESHRELLGRETEWPEKTAGSQLYRCELTFTGKRRPYGSVVDLELLDFPGERVAEAELLEADYAQWSERMLAHLRHKLHRHRAAEFLELVAENRDSTGHAAPLLAAYKLYLGRAMAEDCARLLSPSTFFVDERGSSLANESGGPAEWASCRHSGLEGAEFAPLPAHMAKRSPQLYRSFRRNYARYKRVVVRPLFRRIVEADALVVLVDIPGLLMNGPVSYSDEQQLVEYLLRAASPTGHPWRRLPWRGRLHRLALVATKSDMVDPDDVDRLKGLLAEMTGTTAPAMGRGVRKKIFTCAAIKSTRPVGHHLIEMKLPTAEGPRVERVRVSELPRRWPLGDRWPQYMFREALPRVSSRRDVPPPQVGLDAILRYILGRGKHG